MAHSRKDDVSFGSGPWERTEKRLGVQASRDKPFVPEHAEAVQTRTLRPADKISLFLSLLSFPLLYFGTVKNQSHSFLLCMHIHSAQSLDRTITLSLYNNKGTFIECNLLCLFQVFL